MGLGPRDQGIWTEAARLAQAVGPEAVKPQQGSGQHVPRWLPVGGSLCCGAAAGTGGRPEERDSRLCALEPKAEMRPPSESCPLSVPGSISLALYLLPGPCLMSDKASQP